MFNVSEVDCNSVLGRKGNKRLTPWDPGQDSLKFGPRCGFVNTRTIQKSKKTT